MPTSYTTTVAVTGSTASTLGDQLDSLEIISGSTNPYELPQPPSARASFLGLPVVSGVTQTPDWWIGKEVTFTIAPQGATGTVTWTGYVQSFNCSPVQTSSADQIVELDLLGATSKLAMEIIQGDLFLSPPGYITKIKDAFNVQLTKLSWAEAPAGLTWGQVTTTWANYDNNKSGVTFANNDVEVIACETVIGGDGIDVLSYLTTLWSNIRRGWFWFDNKTVYLNSPNNYTYYPLLTSLNATTCVLWSSLQSSSGLGNVINSVTVQNKSGTSYSSFSGASAALFGTRPLDLGTSYETDASRLSGLCLDKVQQFGYTNKYLNSFTIDLDELTHVTGEWQNFYVSTEPVRLPITNIPTAYGGNETYMVRGVQLNLTRKHAEATLLVVPPTIYNPS